MRLIRVHFWWAEGVDWHFIRRLALVLFLNLTDAFSWSNYDLKWDFFIILFNWCFFYLDLFDLRDSLNQVYNRLDRLPRIFMDKLFLLVLLIHNLWLLLYHGHWLCILLSQLSLIIFLLFANFFLDRLNNCCSYLCVNFFWVNVFNDCGPFWNILEFVLFLLLKYGDPFRDVINIFDWCETSFILVYTYPFDQWYSLWNSFFLLKLNQWVIDKRIFDLQYLFNHASFLNILGSLERL